ncbi:hypothetical protein B7463_g8179, partial [Scytalidium lignicola]
MDLSELLVVDTVVVIPQEAQLNLEPPQPPSDEVEPQLPNTAKVKSFTCFEDVLNAFQSRKKVSFKPFEPEEYRESRALLPEDFPKKAAPLVYFSLFFTKELLESITRSTNSYANDIRYAKKEDQR